jgi:hypothetical protein
MWGSLYFIVVSDFYFADEANYWNDGQDRYLVCFVCQNVDGGYLKPDSYNYWEMVCLIQQPSDDVC